MHKEFRPQQVPERGSCVITALSIVLDTPIQDLREEIGFTGLEIFWPDASGLSQLRSHHIQEINDCALRRGKCFVEYRRWPQLTVGGAEKPKLINDEWILEQRFKDFVSAYRGVLVRHGHMDAWDQDKVYRVHNGTVSQLILEPYFVAFGLFDLGSEPFNCTS